MLYGFVYHGNHGVIELHIAGYPYHRFWLYTERQAKQEYRKLFNLKYKKITWI